MISKLVRFAVIASGIVFSLTPGAPAQNTPGLPADGAGANDGALREPAIRRQHGAATRQAEYNLGLV